MLTEACTPYSKKKRSKKQISHGPMSTWWRLGEDRPCHYLLDDISVSFSLPITTEGYTSVDSSKFQEKQREKVEKKIAGSYVTAS